MSRSSITPAILTALLALSAPLSAADEHAGHNHAAEGAHAHGKAEAVGSVEISVYKIAVSASGAIAAGKEWHVELRLNPDQPVPKAIRVWVGTENGRGSVKAKAEAEKDAKGEYGAHVEVPNRSRPTASSGSPSSRTTARPPRARSPCPTPRPFTRRETGTSTELMPCPGRDVATWAVNDRQPEHDLIPDLGVLVPDQPLGQQRPRPTAEEFKDVQA